jgi:tetratricopeptide (TPR) repeat protein
MVALALPVEKLETGTVATRALTAGEVATMPLRMRSDRGVDEKEAAAIVKEARLAAAPYPEDPGAQIALAEAEFDVGNEDASDTAADRALKANPKAVGALLYKGQVAVRRAKESGTHDPNVWRAARGWFVKANRLDTSNAEPPLLFYSSYLAAGQEPNDNARGALFGAFGLAPEDDEVRFLAVREMLAVGKVDEARQALIVLAYDPHRAPDNWASKAVALIDAGKASEAKSLLKGDNPAEKGSRGGD